MLDCWQSTSLRNCISEEFSGEWGSEPVPAANASVLRSTNIDDYGHVDLAGGAPRRVVVGKLRQKKLIDGDILLEASGGSTDRPVGRTALFTSDGQADYLCSNFFRALRPTSSVTAKFLAWYLLRFYRTSEIWRYQQQTTGIINLKVHEYLRHELQLPPFLEQRRIAEILDTVDQTICKTEQLIGKLQLAKQGLLHDLLTCGIDDNGELRDPEQHPEQFKDTELGKLPKGWVMARLDDVAERGSGHTPSKNVPSYWNGGIKWVSLADSHRLDQIYIYETDKEISELGIANSSAVKHPPGTVILSRDAGIGKSAITTETMAVSQHFMAWYCGPLVRNLYLYYWLQHNKPRFESIALGSTIKTIGLSYFKKLRLPVPPLPEQESAVSALLSAETAVRTTDAEIIKLRKLKTGLMDDLLTGRVRVPM